MKKLTLIAITFLVIGLAPQSVAGAADNLTRGARADMERALLHELSPLVGVFDYVAFKLDGDGTVTLLGQVREPSVKSHVEEDAKKVPGVSRVLNRIEVLPISPADDDIRRAVYNAIYSQTGFSRYVTRPVPPVHIIVKNGTVVLEGVVADKLEYAQVRAAASSVPGVFSVKNNLHVEKAG
jgi:hypothetical protein